MYFYIYSKFTPTNLAWNYITRFLNFWPFYMWSDSQKQILKKKKSDLYFVWKVWCRKIVQREINDQLSFEKYL